jgi:hypothetical protein
MVFVHNFLGSDAFFACFKGNRNTVFVGTANPNNVFARKSKKANKNIRRNINAG